MKRTFFLLALIAPLLLCGAKKKADWLTIPATLSKKSDAVMKSFSPEEFNLTLIPAADNKTNCFIRIQLYISITSQLLYSGNAHENQNRWFRCRWYLLSDENNGTTRRTRTNWTKFRRINGYPTNQFIGSFFWIQRTCIAWKCGLFYIRLWIRRQVFRC